MGMPEEWIERESKGSHEYENKRTPKSKTAIKMGTTGQEVQHAERWKEARGRKLWRNFGKREGQREWLSC